LFACAENDILTPKSYLNLMGGDGNKTNRQERISKWEDEAPDEGKRQLKPHKERGHG